MLSPAPQAGVVLFQRTSRDTPQWFTRLNRNHRNLVFVRQFYHFCAVEYQGLAGGQTKTRRARFDHGFNGRHADHRHIKAHVLIRLGELDYGEAAAHELARPPNYRVSAFHGFDGDAGAIAHHDCLAEIQPRDFDRYLETVFDITTLA